jgi:hypothetical protein
MAQVSVVAGVPNGFPSWVERDIIITNGHDPLGLETIASVRILPLLLPGVLALSRRARYFTFHQFVLDEFVRRKIGSTSRQLDHFMRRAEYEYGYAVKLCSQCGWDARGVLGDIALRQHRWDAGLAVTRQLSIQTRMGGYGLFYRSPLIFFGLVLGEGTELPSGKKVPFDCLAGPRARDLAQLFRDRVAPTAWYKRYLGRDDAIPKKALAELAGAACLCRLVDAPTERAAIFDVLFSDDQPVEEAVDEAQQRRRSFALNLEAIAKDETSVDDVAAWRHQLWTFADGVARSPGGSTAYRGTAAQWGALIAREYQQAGLSIIWNVVCEVGNRNQPPYGFTTSELDALLAVELAKATGRFKMPKAASTMPVKEYEGHIAGEFAESTLEQMLRAGVDAPSGPAGLALLLELRRRLPNRDAMPDQWRHIGGIDGSHQEGLIHFLAEFQRRLDSNPTVLELLMWLAQHFVISRHQHIAAAKLPRFTFRFRRELGRLRFYPDRAHRAFGAGDPRWEPLMLLSEDLGLWRGTDTGGTLTPDGYAMVNDLTHSV